MVNLAGLDISITDYYFLSAKRILKMTELEKKLLENISESFLNVANTRCCQSPSLHKSLQNPFFKRIWVRAAIALRMSSAKSKDPDHPLPRKKVVHFEG